MRSLSEADCQSSIKQAIHRSLSSNDLTGDFSKACSLPLVEGKHVDLKAITGHTLAALVRGEFKNSVASFSIVDCRYPYEFEAGHIDGAINLYTKDQIEQTLLSECLGKPEIDPETKLRNILIFHCEFSVERGPNMSRFLRNIDRRKNKDHYPALHHPEMYLLDGGYNNFFTQHQALCFPQGYRSMQDPDHTAECKVFRNKSKTWQGEKARSNAHAKGSLRRLGF